MWLKEDDKTLDWQRDGLQGQYFQNLPEEIVVDEDLSVWNVLDDPNVKIHSPLARDS